MKGRFKLNNEIKMADAIILGANHHNTYGIVRALSKFHIRPIVIINSDINDCLYKESRYIKYILHVPYEETIKWLIKFGKDNNEIKHVLYVSSDSFSELIDSNSNILREYFYIPSCEYQGTLSRIMDKQEMALEAIEAGLKIPPNTKACGVRELQTEMHKLNFPCILKPIKSTRGHKSDIHICHNKIDLKEALNNISCDYLQIQDYIEKEEEFQLIGLSLNKGDQVIIPGITKLLWTASKSSNTGIVKITPLDSTYDKLIKKIIYLIKKIGYSGSFSAEFLKDKSGLVYFMEINFRNDGNSIVVTAGGVNLPKIWWDFSCHQFKLPREYNISINRIAIATPIWSMLPLARREHQLLKLIWYSIKSTIFMDFTILDPKPLISQIIRKLKTHYLKR